MLDAAETAARVEASGPSPLPPREGSIWWSSAPPAPADGAEATPEAARVSEEQLKEWLSCTAGWKALELSWGALQGCDVRHAQVKPLLQAAMAEAARLGAPRLVVRQVDIDEALARCLSLALAAFPNFTALKLHELNLYDEAIGHLCGALHSAEHLRTLLLDTVWASAAGWSALGSALKVNTSLHAMRLRHCLAGAALAAVCAALCDPHGELQELHAPHNALDDAGVGELCKAMAQAGTLPGTRPSRVAVLDLSHNAATRACVPSVTGMLRSCRAMRRLDLSYNDLGAEGSRELCRALASAPHLVDLQLAGTGSDDGAVDALARSLSGHAAGAGLTTVNLANNRITHKGAALLAAAAKRPGCALTDVDLSGNGQIGEQGAKAWADVLSAATSGPRLRRLIMAGCEVTDGGGYALGAALKANTGLQELGLSENHLTTSGIALLAEVIKVNATLKVLDVSLNMVGPQGMTPFTQMSHLRGHVFFSKSHDHSVKRVSSCLVKAEVTPEYRNVEAVKNSSEPWEREAALTNPFGPVGGGGGAAPHGGPDGGYANPFISPAASYVNPFLSPAASYANPFLEATAAGPRDTGANPFADPGPAAAGAENPFLAPRPDEGGAHEAAQIAGRTEATRVVPRASESSSEEGADGGDGGGAGGSGGDEGGSMHVSSRSTADEADLATDLHMRLIDHLMAGVGVSADE